MNLRDFGQPWMPTGETIWIADAHRGDGRRFIVRADEMLSAFVELESAIRVDTKQRWTYRLRRNRVPNRKFH